MADEPFRSEPPRAPRPDFDVIGSDLVQMWQTLATNAAEIASAKRTLYLAYLTEGFSEAQALDLTKAI